MSSIGSILASQALTIINLTKWIFWGSLNVTDWSRLYFHLEICSLGHQENSIEDKFVTRKGLDLQPGQKAVFFLYKTIEDDVYLHCFTKVDFFFLW